MASTPKSITKAINSTIKHKSPVKKPLTSVKTVRFFEKDRKTFDIMCRKPGMTQAKVIETLLKNSRAYAKLLKSQELK